VSLVTWVALGLAGGLGAVARWLIVIAAERTALLNAPPAILVVNLSGALAIGLLAGAGLDGDARAIVATGFLGGYTTFSTWMVQSEELIRARQPWWAAANLIGSLLLGFGAVALGALA
jgi:fluoride exporter